MSSSITNPSTDDSSAINKEAVGNSIVANPIINNSNNAAAGGATTATTNTSNVDAPSASGSTTTAETGTGTGDTSTKKKANSSGSGSGSNASSTPKVYYAIRKCKGLDGPAVFLKESDANRWLSQDNSAVHQRFSSLDEAEAWMAGNKKKISRKRKSIEDLNNSPAGKSKMLNEVIEKNDHLWEQKFQELKTFTETVGDGDPNFAMQKEYRRPQLQAWLSGQRRNYNRYINNEVNEARSQFDRKERFYKLLELGVRLKPEEPTGSWKEWAQKWRDYRLENPNVPLTTNTNGGDENLNQLAEWQDRQIIDYVTMMRKEQPHEMYPHRVKQLREWDFPFPKDMQPPKKVLKTFDERLQEFVDWKEANASPMVPQSLEGLGEWVKEQRKEYRKKLTGKKTCMSDERLAKLNAAGFVFRIRSPRRRSSSGAPASPGSTTVEPKLEPEAELPAPVSAAAPAPDQVVEPLPPLEPATEAEV